MRRKKRTKMRLLSLLSHAARRSGSSSWDLASTARERQRAAAAAKRFLRAKESGMSAWRKEMHNPPPKLFRSPNCSSVVLETRLEGTKA